jgi:TolB protein
MRTWLLIAVAYLTIVLGACAVFAFATYRLVGPVARTVAMQQLPYSSGAIIDQALRPSGSGTLTGVVKAASPVPTAAPAEGAPGAPGFPGQLLVQANDGNIYAIRPDGTGRQALTTDAGAAHHYRQATWSFDGSRAAWAEYDPSGTAQAGLWTSQADGTDRTHVETAAAPFYISWSPDGSHLAYLANGSDGLDLGLLEPRAGQALPTTLDHGAPLYFSWAPDGRRLLVHTGSDRLGLLSLDGSRKSFDRQPAPFAAPQWSSDGSRLVYAVEDADGRHLLAAALPGASGPPEQDVTSFRGMISFNLSPDGKQVAYVVTRARIGLTTLGPLFVRNLSEEQSRPISEEPVLAFWWSPDSQKLLFLTVDTRKLPDSAEPVVFRPQSSDNLYLRWHIWDGEHTTNFPRFLPSDTFLADYVPYADQYARSMTLWSPDSRAFTYAAQGAGGEHAIWVQPVSGANAQQVMAGAMATWSPH